MRWSLYGRVVAWQLLLTGDTFVAARRVRNKVSRSTSAWLQDQRPVADYAKLEVEMMIEEVQTFRELEPIRMRTIVLAQIERLADERRQLLRTLDRFDDSRVARRRLNEIDEQLSSLWQIRRRELR